MISHRVSTATTALLIGPRTANTLKVDAIVVFVKPCLHQRIAPIHHSRPVTVVVKQNANRIAKQLNLPQIRKVTDTAHATADNASSLPLLE